MENSRFIREGDVRAVIEKSTYTTTLRDLERKGKSKVRVVKARQIYRLIAEAVNQAISNSSIEVADEEKGKLVDESRRELDRILAEHGREEEQFRDQQRKIEKHLRRDLEGCLERIAELKQANEELRLRAGQGVGGPSSEYVVQMLGQLNELREDFKGLRETRTEDSVGTEDIAQLLEQRESQFADRFQNVFDEAMTKFSDQIDERTQAREQKLAEEHVEAAEVVLDSLFSANADNLESNIAKVGVKKRDESGISASLARLKSMARKPITTSKEKNPIKD